MSSQEAGNSPLCPVCRETGPSLHLEAFRRICGVENSGGHDNAFPCMRQMLLSVDGDSLHAVRSRDRRVAGRVCALISSFLSKTNSVTLWCLVSVSYTHLLPFAQARWCGAAGVRAVETLSDHKGTDFGLKYGVLIRELRLLTRAVFVVAPDGTLAYSEIVPEITREPDYNAALDAVARLA